MVASHKGHSDMDMQDIYLLHIVYYVRAEVENRLHNIQVMSLNGFNVTIEWQVLEDKYYGFESRANA
jgi:hypothetical protein